MCVSVCDKNGQKIQNINRWEKQRERERENVRNKLSGSVYWFCLNGNSFQGEMISKVRVLVGRATRWCKQAEMPVCVMVVVVVRNQNIGKMAFGVLGKWTNKFAGGRTCATNWSVWSVVVDFNWILSKGKVIKETLVGSGCCLCCFFSCWCRYFVFWRLFWYSDKTPIVPFSHWIRRFFLLIESFFFCKKRNFYFHILVDWVSNT